MTSITIDIPDDLAELVEQQRDRIPELLALSLNSPPLPAHLYRDILAFFASQPTPSQIAAFAPSEAMQKRLRVLIERSHAETMTPGEIAELDEFERIEHLMVLIKTANLPALTSAS